MEKRIQSPATDRFRYTMAIAGLVMMATSANASDWWVTQSSEGTFWNAPGAPAHINRLADRVFVGPAVDESGECQMCAGTHDWFEALRYNSYNGGDPIYSDGPFAQAYILADPNSAAATAAVPVSAVTLAAETLNGLTGSSVRAMNLTAINNAISGQNPAAWGLYVEGHAVGTSTGTTYGIELDMRNSAGATWWDPMSAPAERGATSGLHFGCGAGLSAVGQYNCTDALSFGANPMPWTTGILFFNGSIASTGPGGTIPAIEMPPNYQIQWYVAPSTLGAVITGDATGGLWLNASQLHIPGSLAFSSPPYGTAAYYACFSLDWHLVASVTPCP